MNNRVGRANPVPWLISSPHPAAVMWRRQAGSTSRATTPGPTAVTPSAWASVTRASSSTRSDDTVPTVTVRVMSEW